MGRVAFDDIERYGGQGGAGFFSLKNDKDVAQVRILYNGVEDIEGYAVHKVDVRGSQYGRYVNCLRKYDEPRENCPFCRENIAQQVRLFIPLYNIDEDKMQIWDRGKKFASKITSLCSRYPNLVSHVFEIERNGKPKDQQTSYEIYEVDKDDTTLEDLDIDIPDMLGGVVLDKSADDMEYYLEEGEFPPDEDEEELPVRRRGSRRDESDTDGEESEEEERPRGRRVSSRNSVRERRTPAKSNSAKSRRENKSDEEEF